MVKELAVTLVKNFVNTLLETRNKSKHIKHNNDYIKYKKVNGKEVIILKKIVPDTRIEIVDNKLSLIQLPVKYDNLKIEFNKEKNVKEIEDKTINRKKKKN